MTQVQAVVGLDVSAAKIDACHLPCEAEAEFANHSEGFTALLPSAIRVNLPADNRRQSPDTRTSLAGGSGPV